MTPSRPFQPSYPYSDDLSHQDFEKDMEKDSEHSFTRDEMIGMTEQEQEDLVCDYLSQHLLRSKKPGLPNLKPFWYDL